MKILTAFFMHTDTKRKIVSGADGYLAHEYGKIFTIWFDKIN